MSRITDHRVALQLKFAYAIGGLVVGVICILGGLVLFLNGVAGSTSWTAEFLGARSQINDAAPGAIFAIVGLFLVFVTRLKVKLVTETEETRVHDPTTGRLEIKTVKR